jgi:uncharacterized membrane protein
VLTLLLIPLLFHAPIVAGATSDFTLSAFYAYDSSTPIDTIILTGLNGYSGFVALTLSSPPSGFHISLDRNNATLSSSTTSVNRYLFASADQPGNYTVIITATDGTLSHSITIKYNIVPGTAPNFSIDSSQGLTYGWDILRGSSDVSGISVRSSNGFAGTVVLEATSFPPGFALSFDHSSVRVQPGTPGVAIMRLSVPATIPVGSYTVVLNGTSGPLTQVVYLNVVVIYGIALTANPNKVTLPQGGQVNSIITLSSQGGWTGTTGISATCPSLACSLNPPSLQLQNPTSTVQSDLTVSIPPTTLPGEYTINIAETNPTPTPSYTQTTSLTIVVTGPDFTTSASPRALTFTPGMAGSLQTIVTLTSLNGFSGYVNTTVSVSPTVGPPLPHSPSATPNSTRVQLTPSGPQSFTITISVDTMVMEGPYLVQITGVTLMPGGLLSHSFYVVATVGPDFSVSASSANLIIHQGTLATSNITFTSLNGFAGGIMLLLEPFSALPPDPRNYFFPTYPILSPGGTNTTELVVMADQFTGLGTFNAWVDASTSVQVGFGWVSHAFPITVTIEGPLTGPDFKLSAQPSHSYVSISSTTTSTVSVTSVNGFGGALTLHVEGYGIFGSLSPGSAIISSATSASSTLTITTPTPYQIDGYPLWYPFSGNRSLLVIASNSMGLSHGIWVNATEAPVSVVPNPPQLEIATGSSATSQIVVSSLSGFNLTVSMSADVSPPGPATFLSNNFINFSASTLPVSPALSINVPSTTAQGDYVVLVTATAMSYQWFCQCGYYNITYTTSLYVHVIPPSSNQGPPPGQGPPSGPGNPSPQPKGSTAGIFGLPPTEFYGIVSAVTIALVVSAGYLTFRLRKLATRSEAKKATLVDGMEDA